MKSYPMNQPSPAVQQALDVLHAIKPLNRPLQAYLSAYFHVRHYHPNDFLLRAGEVCEHLSFVAEGLVQIYSECTPVRNDFAPREICHWFLMEGDLALSVQSFFGRKPADENIQALEATTVVQISYEDLQDVYAAFPEFNYHGRIVTEAYYIKAIQQLKSLRYRRAADSYKYLEQNCPNLLKRVPAENLASYLGVDETYVRALDARRKYITA